MLTTKRARLRATVVAASLLAALCFSAAAPAGDRTTFKVCADPNYLPYSNEALEGFENKIAEMLAGELKLPTTYTWFPQRMGFIRHTLRGKNENGEYLCDVVMGLPAGYELAITTKPYYRSTYAMVYVKGRGLDDVKSSDDLLALDAERKSKLRFGLAERNPGNTWLARNNLLDRLVVAYPSQLGDPNERPGILEQQDLLANRIDVTIMWGPIAGYFAKTTKEAEIAVIPMRSQPGVKFDFAISVGVRFGDGDWRNQLQGLLDENTARINDLLESYGVPLVDEAGNPL